MLEKDTVERILVITAHPDDVDFGAAGTIAGWVEEGIAVTYCIITDGDAGGADPTVPRGEIAGIRQAEQRAAGAVLGVSDIRFLGYRDGELTVTHDLRRDLSRVIRQVRPQRVLMQSPDRNWKRIYASHPDHLAAGACESDGTYGRSRRPHHRLAIGAGRRSWATRRPASRSLHGG